MPAIFGASRSALRKSLAVAALVVLGSNAAHASVLLELYRLSDTDVLLVGSGSVGPSVPPENIHALFLSDPFTVRPSPGANTSLLMNSDLRAGSFEFNFANDAGGGTIVGVRGSLSLFG